MMSKAHFIVGGAVIGSEMGLRHQAVLSGEGLRDEEGVRVRSPNQLASNQLRFQEGPD